MAEAADRVVRPARRERREHGEAERAADLLRVLNRPDASPASSEAMFVVAISVSGTKTSPIPIDITQEAGKQVGEVRAVRRDAAEEEQTAAPPARHRSAARGAR